jgi:capsule polysaccharide export protein KpsE/RkpR
MTIIIKDLSQEQTVSPFGALLMSSGSEFLKDARLLEVYIKSNDMYELLDQEFNLTAYYTSDHIDIVNRLSNGFILPMFEESRVNFLDKYKNDLTIVFDEASETLEVAFAHSERYVAKKIVESIIQFAGERLNYFDRKNSEVILTFLKEQEQEKYNLFLSSLKKLLIYQNQHSTISPKIDVESKSAILAQLEGELVQHEVNYNSKLQYMNHTVPEMKLLKSTMNNIRKKIQKLKRETVGNQQGQGLNENLSDFELLKSEVEFNKQVYMQVLGKLEETSVLVSQNSKNIIVVSEAKVSDSYDYPKKLNDILSAVIIFGLIYGILGFIITLIRDHKD